MDKECRICGESKPVSEYYKDQSTKDRLRSACKACILVQCTTYNRAHRADRQADWAQGRARLNTIKLIAGCQDCGYRGDPARLHFDHLPGYTKSFNLSRAVGFNKRRVAREMMKCEIVCDDCHKQRTTGRIDGQLLPA